MTFEEAFNLLIQCRFVRRSVWPEGSRLIGNRPFGVTYVDANNSMSEYVLGTDGSEEAATDWEEYIPPVSMPPEFIGQNMDAA
jgi:hypothetical protein